MSKRTIFILSFSFPFFLGTFALWVFISSDLARQKTMLEQEAVARLQVETDLFAAELAFRLQSIEQGRDRKLDLIDKVPGEALGALATSHATESTEGFAIISATGQPIWQSSQNLIQLNEIQKSALINTAGRVLELQGHGDNVLVAVSQRVKDYPLVAYAIAEPVTLAMSEGYASIRLRWLGC
jgi:hypothetical protein